MHRATKIAPGECGWKHGDSSYSAGENLVKQNHQRIRLTPTGLLMEGDITSLRFSFAQKAFFPPQIIKE